MTTFARLIPELADWNHGVGISPETWICIEGRADHALGFCALMWPEFVEFEGYVLRAPLDIERLRGWERGGEFSRQQIETAMNLQPLQSLFPKDETAAALKDAQCERLATIMAEMLRAKLACEFPDRRFSTPVLTGEDLGLTFHQV